MARYEIGQVPFSGPVAVNSSSHCRSTRTPRYAVTGWCGGLLAMKADIGLYTQIAWVYIVELWFWGLQIQFDSFDSPLKTILQVWTLVCYCEIGSYNRDLINALQVLDDIY